ncbi:MAG: ATP-binding cassette domain-containing protein, partial [Burkholderiales bacterium]|nr:ATP-binding cassette domain-containing protein [Anaerolineae bacterium]
MDIELRHIHKRFGPIHANNDINLTFKGGRIIGVLGENGAGKSTLMKILSGFQPADSGEILVGGRSVHYVGPQSAIQFGIGMLQQDPLDVPAFTVLENFIYGHGSGLGMNRKKARTQLNIINRRFGFDLDAETPVSQLTIAQRQQLEIGRLLTLGVRTLILDEPTTGISSEQKELLFEALHEISQHDGMTVLIVSHKLEDVVALCNEVVVLRAGKVVGERQMPATTKQLVAMMFGEELTVQTKEQQAIKEKRTSDREIVVLERVSLREKRLHIDNLSMRVYAGQIIGLAGLDGSGQELVMRACVGLAKTHGGRVLVEGRDMTGRPY